MVPKWKRELMDRRKVTHRDQPPLAVETKSSAADRSDATVEPPWMRELNQRKKRGERGAISQVKVFQE